MNFKPVSLFLPVIAFAMLIGICPATVIAQESGASDEPSPFIQRFDRNGDGLVSIDEFPGSERRFDRLDSNGDGTIDADEAPQRPSQHRPDPEELIADFDEDGDGQLSLEEFPGPDHHFERLDSDKNGFLTSEELLAGRPGPPPGKRNRFESE